MSGVLGSADNWEELDKRSLNRETEMNFLQFFFVSEPLTHLQIPSGSFVLREYLVGCSRPDVLGSSFK